MTEATLKLVREALEHARWIAEYDECNCVDDAQAPHRYICERCQLFDHVRHALAALAAEEEE